MSSASGECNWFLLFDIALSHGDSLRQQRLSYSGLMMLLRSAGILAPNTGVYGVLLEALWHAHGHSPEWIERGDMAGREQGVHNLVVGFDGFLAVMNVVCIRCFQTHLSSELVDEKRPISEVIILSAEDQVKLRESVVFTARRFFKPLISRCIVSRKMVVSLDPTKNNWTPYTNRFVTHVVAESGNSVILPLFCRYAQEGRIYRAAFEQMLEDVFPEFTTIQMKSAMAVFDYNGFFGIHHLVGQFCIDFVNVSTAALELDSFSEALLMLGIVAFSDETTHKHRGPFTAKVWSVFEDYYYKFLGVPMMQDPVLENKFAHILPCVSLVFPSRVPLDKVSSFIIGGWNLTVDGKGEDSIEVAEDFPPRILQPREVSGKKEEASKRRVSNPVPSSSVELAFKLFEEELDHVNREQYNLPLYGMKRCKVYVDQHPATAVQRGPNRVEVMIPVRMWDASIKGTQIHFSEDGEEGKLTLTSTTKATVSLCDIHGDTTYSSKDVVFVAAPLIERISSPQMEVLKDIFSRYGADDGMSLDQFDQACAELCVDTLAVQVGGCSSFLRAHLRWREEDGLPPCDGVNPDGSLSFSAFVAALATLLLQRLETNGSFPNIPSLLGVAMSRATQKNMPLPEHKSVAVSLTPRLPPVSTQPHNARIDVPYMSALRKKASALCFHTSAEDILRNVGKDTVSLRPLPEFPPEASTMNIVMQQDDEDGLRAEVIKTSTSLRDAFFKEEMVVCHQGWKAE